MSGPPNGRPAADRATARARPQLRRPGPVAVQRWRRRSSLDRAGVYLATSAGGALGGLARWGIGAALPTRPDGFPWPTLLINAVGCFAIGFLMVLILDVWTPRRYVRPFLVVGVLGGFTTFSTYMVESRALIGGGHDLLAAAYVAGTLVAGLAAVRLGSGLAALAARSR